MNETNGENKMNDKKYALSELTTCRFDPTHILVIKNAYKLKGELLCSKCVKSTYLSDMKLSW